MTDKGLTLERIKKDAIEYAKSLKEPLVDEKYVAEDYEKGAISERNKALQEAIELILNPEGYSVNELVDKLETLKL